MLYYNVLLEELNDRYAFYYRKMNQFGFSDIGGAKVIHVSEHHQAIEFIYRHIPHDIGTIISVDAHIDENDAKNDLKFYQSLIGNHNISLSQVKTLNKHLFRDCGSVLVPMLVPYHNHHGVFWILPDWFYETDRKLDLFLSRDSDCCYFYLTDPSNKDVIYHKEFVQGDTPVSLRMMQAHALKKYHHEISDGYVLNIDLDYFACYGCTETKAYLERDTISRNRTDIDFKKSKKCKVYFEKKYEELFHELVAIEKRIDALVHQVKLLKAIGKAPELIVLCDSTRVDFSLFASRWSPRYDNLSMEFTPKYLIFWLRKTLYEKLAAVLM